MTTKMWRNNVRVDGAGAVDLVFAGFAHFTAMEVRDGAVRGLDLHLHRLQQASLALFGRELDQTTVRRQMRTALADGPADASVMVAVHTPEGEYLPEDPESSRLEVTVRIDPASDGPTGPLALQVVEHERFMPRIKHVGEGAKTYYLRQAQAAGFDDAAFADRRGNLSEASIWNLAFFDGEAVIWPEAVMLAGTTMQILQRQLDQIAVPQHVQPVGADDLTGLSAVVMNSWTPGVTVHRIGALELPPSAEFANLLAEAFDNEIPVQP